MSWLTLTANLTQSRVIWKGEASAEELSRSGRSVNVNYEGLSWLLVDRTGPSQLWAPGQPGLEWEALSKTHNDKKISLQKCTGRISFLGKSTHQTAPTETVCSSGTKLFIFVRKKNQSDLKAEIHMACAFAFEWRKRMDPPHSLPRQMPVTGT